MTEERGIRLTSKIEVNRLISDFYYRLPEDSIVYELIPDFQQLPIEKMGRE